MKKVGKGLLTFLVGAGLCLTPLIPTFAEDGKPVLNTICPVSGQKANAKVTTVYQGKEYAFCCKNCLAKFEKNPEKYIAKIKTEHDGN